MTAYEVAMAAIGVFLPLKMAETVGITCVDLVEGFREIAALLENSRLYKI